MYKIKFLVWEIQIMHSLGIDGLKVFSPFNIIVGSFDAYNIIPNIFQENIAWNWMNYLYEKS